MIKRLTINSRLVIALVVTVTLLAMPVGLAMAAVGVTGIPNPAPTPCGPGTPYSDSGFVSAQLPSNVVGTLESAVVNFIYGQAPQRHFDIKSLTARIIAEKLKGDQVEVLFHASYLHRLNIATVNDAAVVQGAVSYLDANKGEMSSKGIQIVNSRIARIKSIISGYMKNWSQDNEFLLAVAKVGDAGSVLPGTVVLYAQDPVGYYWPASTYYRVPNNQTVRQNSYNDTKTILNHKLETLSKVKSANNAVVNPLSISYYNYSGAADYANYYTSNTSLTCSDGVTLQDPSHYNPAYNYYKCDDCANYVSQAMNLGGSIPTTSDWEPYTSDWINVGDLVSYMQGQGIFLQGSFANAMPGDVVELGNYHVQMVVYNDGSTMEISSHTSDRDAVQQGNLNYATYWLVVVTG